MNLKEINEVIKEDDIYQQVKNCRFCGSCVSNWKEGHRCSLSTQLQGVQINSRGLNRMLQMILADKLDFSEEMIDLIFRCVSCNTCVGNCNEGIEARVYIEALRKELVERGIMPNSVVEIFKSVINNGNVWSMPKNQRNRWAEDLSLRTLPESKDFEYLLFVGDSSSYVPRNQEAAKKFVEILNHSGIKFAYLGNEETCSGNEILRMGEEGLFEKVANENIENLLKYNVKKVITLSPHDYHAIKNEYPKINPKLKDLEVFHSTQLIDKLIKEGTLKLTKNINKTVTYHDPCYLGRHNLIYDEPREILNAIPGLILNEMDYVKVEAVCCGGGGGGIWMERGNGVIVDDLRFNQALKTNADILITACPFCTQQFEALNDDANHPIEIKDIIELVYSAI